MNHDLPAGRQVYRIDEDHEETKMNLISCKSFLITSSLNPGSILLMIDFIHEADLPADAANKIIW